MKKRVQLKTINDLERVGLQTAKQLISRWEIAKILREWPAKVAALGIPHETRHSWNEDRTALRFHPSSFGHSCDMRLFLELVGGSRVKKKLSWQPTMDIGTAAHLMMNYYMHTLALYKGFTYDHEVALWKGSPTADKYRLCGSADGVVELEIEFYDVILELRAVFDWKTISETGMGKLRETPKLEYVKQVHGYMVAGDIPVAIVFYVQLKGPVFQALPVFYTPQVWEPIAQRLSRICEVADRIEEPLKTVAAHCKTCEFLEDCEPAGLEKITGSASSSSRGYRPPRL